jgi:hypothetical protein
MQYPKLQCSKKERKHKLLRNQRKEKESTSQAVSDGFGKSPSVIFKYLIYFVCLLHTSVCLGTEKKSHPTSLDCTTQHITQHDFFFLNIKVNGQKGNVIEGVINHVNL